LTLDIVNKRSFLN